MTLERPHRAIAWATMAHDHEPGWSDLTETDPEDLRAARREEAGEREQ